METKTFAAINSQMTPLLEQLQKSTAYSNETLRNLDLQCGVYVFYQDGKAKYVGRVGPHSKQAIRRRIAQHCRGRPSEAPLASLMTIEYLGLGSLTRAQLTSDYRPQFDEQQTLVRNMKIRAVEIKCCATQAVFEIYAALTLQTPYNDFCTH